MARVQYTYMVAYVYHSMSFVLYECLQGRMCLSTTTAGNLFVSWIFVYLIANRDRFYSLSVESRMHLKCCICFTETKKNPFSSSIVFAQSLTCVFFSLSGESQDSPNTAQGADRKVLFGGENKVFWCWFLSPQRTLRKERCGETKKKVFLFALS